MTASKVRVEDSDSKQSECKAADSNRATVKAKDSDSKQESHVGIYEVIVSEVLRVLVAICLAMHHLHRGHSAHQFHSADSGDHTWMAL